MHEQQCASAILPPTHPFFDGAARRSSLKVCNDHNTSPTIATIGGMVNAPALPNAQQQVGHELVQFLVLQTLPGQHAPVELVRL